MSIIVPFTNAQIANVYIKNKCDKSKTAQFLGISHADLNKVIAEREDLKRVLAEADNCVVDMVESALLKLVRSGHFNAIKFFLEAKARDRGYGQKPEDLDPDNDEKFSSMKFVGGNKVIELK
jgi:hypothetical protein